ncbi:MAG: YwaF family protein [Candidatus Marinimicrobia bacterium]|nr:YwaF family protein [Candidatus Neomarinimicrobiota bacterium]
MWRERLNQLSYENTIPMFGRDHLIYLLVILLVSATFLIFAKKTFNKERANKIATILGIVALVHLFLKIPVLRLILGLPLATSLPLHLCNFGMIMVGILLISKKQWALELAYF